jgi:hypothetical protein
VQRELPNADAMLRDELADVSIMITQIISFMDEDEKVMLSKLINAKLDSQLQIISSEGADYRGTK